MTEVLTPSSIWKRLLSVAHHAGFTQNEAGVIVFLVIVLLSGAALEALQSDDASKYRRQDVRQALAVQDSVFAVQSMRPAVTQTSVLGTGTHDVESRHETPDVSGNPVMIDINSAGVKELEALPGVGPATARKIIAYRTEHGRFVRTEDIMRVKSIGPKKFENIRQFITLE